MKTYTHTGGQSFLSVSKIEELCYVQYGNGAPHAEIPTFQMLMYVEKGQVRIRIGAHVYAVEEGEVLLFGKGCSCEAVGDWDGVCAGFVGFHCEDDAIEKLKNQAWMPDAAAGRLLKELFSEGVLYLENVPADRPYTGQKLRKDAPPFASEIVRRRVELLLLRLYEQTDKETALPRKIHTENPQRELVHSIELYVRKHINVPVSAKVCAAEIGVSPAKLREVCREQFGRGFREYHAGKRIEEAIRLMQQKKLTFTEIAIRLGYASVSTFSKCFTKEIGYTPTVYRRWFLE